MGRETDVVADEPTTEELLAGKVWEAKLRLNEAIADAARHGVGTKISTYMLTDHFAYDPPLRIFEQQGVDARCYHHGEAIRGVMRVKDDDQPAS